jgi:hypothetical protein
MPVRQVQFCEAAHAKFIICIQTIDGPSSHHGLLCCVIISLKRLVAVTNLIKISL